MLLKTTYPKSRSLESPWIINYSYIWRLIVITCLMILFFAPQSGQTKEKNNHSSRLPPAPDTGSPEEDFAAGGTRDGRLRNTVCGKDTQNIVYLLGNKNREFTASAYPSFWFHIPQNINKINKMQFIVTELATGKKIYDRVLPKPQKPGIIGVNLPQSPKYALSSKTNYTWSLHVDCAGTQQDVEIALTGWLSRLPSNSKLQNQLAHTSELEKYKVYLQHNLLYDALTDLAELRIAKPNNPNIEIAWTDLLSKLGWQDIMHPKSAVYRSDVDMQIANMSTS
jgi:hypothetical protein